MNYYYHPDPTTNPVLNTEESSHAIKVLRMKKGDQIHLVDGLGKTYVAEITEDNFRKCGFKVLSVTRHEQKHFTTHIAISPTKNIDRIEWFIEKACELGVSQISLIQTKRTERSKVKMERLEKKAVSAMKQSKNFWKCQVNALSSFDKFIKTNYEVEQRFVAYVETGQEESLFKLAQPNKSTLILIGPEGDFTPEEILLANANQFQAVNLGHSILRTETAGIISAHTINLVNE